MYTIIVPVVCVISDSFTEIVRFMVCNPNVPRPYNVSLAIVSTDQGITFLLRSNIDFLMNVACILTELNQRSIRIITNAVFGLPDNTDTGYFQILVMRV